MNWVPACTITLILGKKIEFGYCLILFGTVILRKGNSSKASLHYFALFALRKIDNLYLHGSQLNQYLCLVCLDDLNFAYTPCYSLLCQVEYVKLPWFCLTELHNRIVIPSAQVEFEGTYGHVLVHRQHLYVFEVVLVIFEKGQQDFALFRTFCTQCKMSIFDFRRS